MKKIFLVLILCCVSVGLFADSLRIAVFNVWSGLTYKGFFSVGELEGDGARQKRFDFLEEELTALKPDVIVLNEANPLPSYIKPLADALNYSYIFNVNRGGVRVGKIGLPSNLREGDAILANEKMKLEKVDTRLITGGPAGNTFSFQIGETCQVMVGKVMVGTKEVYIFVTQWLDSPFADKVNLQKLVDAYAGGKMSSQKFVDKMEAAVKGQEKRMKQAKLTLDFINEIASNKNVIFVGSLNALPNSDEIKLFLDNGFIDAFSKRGSGSGNTYDAKYNTNIKAFFPETAKLKQQFRIDYILVRGDDLRVREAKVILNRKHNGSHLSDHYGIYARIEVKR